MGIIYNPRTDPESPEYDPSGANDWFNANGIGTHTRPAAPPAGDEVTADNFDAAAYLKAYPDVARAINSGQYQGTAWDHYQRSGKAEGRTATVLGAGTTSTTPPTNTAAVNNFGSKANLDKAYLEGKIKAAFAKKGNNNPSQQEIDYWVAKVSKPDTYSDGKIRVGWNPYREGQLLGTQVSPDMAGDEGIVGAGVQDGQGGGGGFGGGLGGGQFTPYGGPEFSTQGLGSLASFQAPNWPGQPSQFTGSVAPPTPITPGTISAPPPINVPQVNAPNIASPAAVNAPTIAGPQQALYTAAQAAAPISAQSVVASEVAKPDAVNAQAINAQTIATPAQIAAQQVQGPAALTAEQIATPTGYQGLTKAQLEADPSYQFRLSQGLGAFQNSAAAKGMLHNVNTLKGLNDYAGQSASQEYAAADARARQTYNDTFQQGASVINANNASNAQAYGLTNQYQQQAALANQSANLNASQQNVSNLMNAHQFNAGAQNTAAAQNASNALNAGQFNVSAAQQAALANQSANLNASSQNAQNALNASQFNAGQQNTLSLQNAANALQASQFNAGLGTQVNTANAQNNLAAGQFNANLGYQSEAQNAQNALNASGQNANNAISGYNAVMPLSQAAQGQNIANQMSATGQNNATNLANGQFDLSAFNANQAAQNQAYTQLAQTHGLNLAGNQQAFNQAFQAWQGNTNAAMGYGQFGLAAQNQDWTQAFNQNGQTFDQWYKTMMAGKPE